MNINNNIFTISACLSSMIANIISYYFQDYVTFLLLNIR